jgi:hypothetical protein
MTTDNTEAPAVMPAQVEAPKFAGGKSRSKTIVLDWPVEFAGKTYEQITVRRMTGAEVSAWANSAGSESLPMFDCPQEVVDALDADDAEAVSKAVIDFLPRRMRAASE